MVAPALRRFWRLFRLSIWRAFEHDAFGTAKASAYSSIFTFFPALLVLGAILATLSRGQVYLREISYALGTILPAGSSTVLAYLRSSANRPVGLLISNGEFVGRWSSTDAVCLDIGPKVEGKVSLVNCSFWGPIDRCVWMQSPAGQFTASACHFVNWDNRGVGSPAIQLDAGKAIIQGCTFAQEGLNVQVGSNVISAILTANQALRGFQVDNAAGKHTQSALNEEDDIPWTREALSHYQVGVGREGDGRYLQGWHAKDGGSEPFRWSAPVSRLLLPVALGEPYTITLEV